MAATAFVAPLLPALDVRDMWANGVFESLIAFVVFSQQAGFLCEQLRPRVVERARSVLQINSAAFRGVVNATAVRARAAGKRTRRLW